MDVSIIIPTFNGAHRIPNLLESLLKQNDLGGVKYEIVVVDNNSSDDVKSVVNSYCVKSGGLVRYLFEERKGASNARNTGIVNTNAPFLLFTDDDCVVASNWIRSFYDAFSTHEADLVQGKVTFGTEIGNDCSYPMQFLKNRLAFVDYYKSPQDLGARDAVSANLGVRRRVFDDFGLFSTQEPFASCCEDTEFSRRISGETIRRVYSPEVQVAHHFELRRLNDKYFFRQSYLWGKAAIVLEPSEISRIKFIRYCIKQILLRCVNVGWNRLRRRDTFHLQLEMYGFAGRISQLLRRHP